MRRNNNTPHSHPKDPVYLLGREHSSVAGKQRVGRRQLFQTRRYGICLRGNAVQAFSIPREVIRRWGPVKGNRVKVRNDRYHRCDRDS
jgi:hypothetical protein